MAGKSSWDQANRRQKLGLVWRIRKKISQIIKDYFYLPFFLLIILWCITNKARQTAYCMLENLCSAADTDTGSSDFLTIDPGRTKIRTVNNITDHNSENLISG
jgi:hypothetical protein